MKAAVQQGRQFLRSVIFRKVRPSNIADKERVAEYETGPYKGFAEDVQKGFASIVPPDADAFAVGEAIVKVVETPFGKRPFRVHIDPTQDGAEVVNMVCDRVRAELLRRIGLEDVLTPANLV